MIKSRKTSMLFGIFVVSLLLSGCFSACQQYAVRIEEARLLRDRTLDVTFLIENFTDKPFYLLQSGTDVPELYVMIQDMSHRQLNLCVGGTNSSATPDWIDLVPARGKKTIKVRYILASDCSTNELLMVTVKDPFNHGRLIDKPVMRLDYGYQSKVMRKGEMPRKEMSHAEVASRKEALLAVKGIGCDWNDEKKGDFKIHCRGLKTHCRGP